MHRVEILGISEHSKSRQLKQQVVQALRTLGIGLPVWDVSSVNEIVDSHISATPALRVDGEVIIQQDLPEQEALVALLEKTFIANQVNIQAKKLIVPTDFSNASRNAYHYALELATFLDTSVKAIHVYSGAFTSASTKSDIDNVGLILDHLNTFVQENGMQGQEINPPQFPIEFEAILGAAIPNLIRLSKSPEAEMFVMGTKGSHGVVEQLLGTVSVAVAQQAYCPVLIIPPGVVFKRYRKILLASNYLTGDSKILEKVSRLAALFQSSVHFVHVNEKGGNEGDYEQVVNSIVDALFEKKTPGFSFEMKAINADSAQVGLNNYVQEKDIDLCIFVAPHRNFMERFVHKSLTKQMARYTKIPMLVYHK